MRMVSSKQSHAISGLVGTNVDWDQVSFEAGESILADPTGFGQRATRFMQNGGTVGVTLTDGIIPPPGGRIQILTVEVDESQPWDNAVRAAGPNTGADWDIWRVGDQYPQSVDAGIKQVFLANFGEGTIKSEHVLEWGKDQRLIPATPRSTFAVAERYPGLDKHLGINPMVVVTLVPCSRGGHRRVPCVWWGGVERKAHLLSRFGGVWVGVSWFAFGRE